MWRGGRWEVGGDHKKAIYKRKLPKKWVWTVCRFNLMFNVWMLLRSVDNLLKDKLEEIVNVLCSLFDLALFS